MADVQIGKTSYAPDQVFAKVKQANSWFMAIIALSFVNSLLSACGAKISFVIGLASTMFVDALVMALREHYTGAEYAFVLIGLAINLVPLGIYFLIWWLSTRGNATAYAFGIALYALDTLVMLLTLNIFAVAFHAYFLVRIIMGYPFVNAYQRAQFALMQPDTQPLPVPQAGPAPMPEAGLGPVPGPAAEPVGVGTTTGETM